MKRTMVLGALGISVIVLAGCAAPAHTAAALKRCDTSASCDVPIDVNGDGNTCTVDVGEIHVGRGHTPEITWTIRNTGAAKYEFKPGGIAFNNKADPVPPGEFEDKGVQGGGSGYRMKDQHKVSGKKFNYKITANAASGSPCVLDPIVANE